MKLTIDNLDGGGPHDYTPFLDGARMPHLVRELNKPAELQFSLVANVPNFVVPINGARVLMGRLNGQDVFTGYVVAPPTFEYLGYGGQGPVIRYHVVACSDEVLLDRRTIRRRAPFVIRSAGDALRQLAEDLMPGVFDTSAVEDVDMLPQYTCDPQKSWSEHAAEIALRARASYRALDGRLVFTPLGKVALPLSEADPAFSPDGLKVTAADKLVNDVTVIGMVEPQAHVKDYFVGDGYSLKYYLSQVPFMGLNRTLVDEEYAELDATRWTVTDPEGAVSVSGGKLVVAGGTGNEGETTLTFAEKMELGGALILQHGDISFDSASRGVIGGLYPDALVTASCLAGFAITPQGANSQIRAILGGNPTGTLMATRAGCRYVFTTRLYGTEVYRQEQVFHSTAHPAGSGRGGAALSGDVRVVLEVHEIDPTDPASMVALSTVLYDGIVAGPPGFCRYVPINATDLHCSVAFTRILRGVNAEVRSALPGQAYRTRLAGSLSDGAECKVSSEPALQFYPQSMPAPNELIAVHYRGAGRALARVKDPDNIAATARNGDDGVRAAVKNLKSPAPRTAQDCEQAALAILDDATGAAWSGSYETWSDFLPGGADDVFPGDALDVVLPAGHATFRGIVREVAVEFADLGGEHSRYTIRFASDAAEPVALELSAGLVTDALDLAPVTVSEVGNEFLADLTAAEITGTSSTTVTIDAGVDPSNGGIEIRWSDVGWGPDNDRNLVGRFTARSFTVPRLGRVQNYYLRLYDNDSPAKYSRYSTALHLDYPL